MDEATLGYEPAIDEVRNLQWAALDQTQLTAVAWAYYFFSVQFRENLEVLHRKYPDDLKVQRLVQEECATDNLSPWPGVAAKAEKINHDEFMRRTLQLGQLVDHEHRVTIEMAGEAYLTRGRRMDDETRVMSIASYDAVAWRVCSRQCCGRPIGTPPCIVAGFGGKRLRLKIQTLDL